MFMENKAGKRRQRKRKYRIKIKIEIFVFDWILLRTIIVATKRASGAPRRGCMVMAAKARIMIIKDGSSFLRYSNAAGTVINISKIKIL